MKFYDFNVEEKERLFIAKYYTEVKGRPGLNFHVKYIHKSHSRTFKIKHL